MERSISAMSHLRFCRATKSRDKIAGVTWHLDRCHTCNFVAQLCRSTKLQCATVHVAHCDKSHKQTKQTWLLVTLMTILLQVWHRS